MADDDSTNMDLECEQVSTENKPQSNSYKRHMLTKAALGRPFHLGMLYDCRTDTLVTGPSLWDKTTIEEKTHSEHLEYSSVHLITGDSLDDKTKHMDISVEGKLGIMSGLIDVSGSAKYLNDTKSSKKHSRVSLHYQSTSEFRSINGIELKNEKKNEVHVGIATHVVTGILYGADAVFVFDHKLDEKSTKSALKVQGDMEAAIKKLQIKAGAGMNLSEEQESIKEEMSCKFYGDMILEVMPTTFTEARDAYKNVIKAINIGDCGSNRRVQKELEGAQEHGPGEGESKAKKEKTDSSEKNQGVKNSRDREKEKVVPKKVWLLPLNLFIDNAPTVQMNISDGIVANIQSVIQKFQELKITATDLKTTYSFPPFSDHYIQGQLDDFLLLLDFRLNGLTTEVKNLLPQIRSGACKDGEDQLLALLKQAEESPFDDFFPTYWLEAKENEARTLKSLFSLVNCEGIDIAGTPGQFNSILIATPWKYLLVVEFKVPHREFDPFPVIDEKRSSTEDSVDSLPHASHGSQSPLHVIAARAPKHVARSMLKFAKMAVKLPSAAVTTHRLHNDADPTNNVPTNLGAYHSHPDFKLETEQTQVHSYMAPEQVLEQKSIVQSFVNFASVNKGKRNIKFAVTLAPGKINEDVRKQLVSIKLYRKDDGKAIPVILPSKPRKLELIHDAKNKSITVTWKEPKVCSTEKMTYTITLTNERTKTKDTKVSTTEMKEKFEGLVRDQKYIVSVQANFLVPLSISTLSQPNGGNDHTNTNAGIVGLSEKKEKSFVLSLRDN